MKCIDFPENDTHLCVCEGNGANSDELGVSDCSSKHTFEFVIIEKFLNGWRSFNFESNYASFFRF